MTILRRQPIKEKPEKKCPSARVTCHSKDQRQYAIPTPQKSQHGIQKQTGEMEMRAEGGGFPGRLLEGQVHR